jgi:hypothetical protein
LRKNVWVRRSPARTCSARFSARAQSVSFNFRNTLIRALGARELDCRVRREWFPSMSGLGRSAASGHAMRGGRFGPQPAARAAKKVAGSWPPGQMQPVPMRSRPR